MPPQLENLPLQPLVDQLSEIIDLQRANQNQQAQQKTQQAYDKYSALCFERRIVQPIVQRQNINIESNVTVVHFLPRP